MAARLHHLNIDHLRNIYLPHDGPIILCLLCLCMRVVGLFAVTDVGSAVFCAVKGANENHLGNMCRHPERYRVAARAGDVGGGGRSGFLRMRLSHSSSSVRAVSKRMGRTLRHKEMDSIWDTRRAIPNVNLCRPRTHNKRRC